MADMVSFSIRVNPKVRDEANALFESPGLDFATATRIFYQAAIDCGGFPFEVKKKLLNEETIKTLRDAERGIGMSEPFDTAAERMEWLYTDDSSDAAMQARLPARYEAWLQSCINGENRESIRERDTLAAGAKRSPAGQRKALRQRRGGRIAPDRLLIYSSRGKRILELSRTSAHSGLFRWSRTMAAAGQGEAVPSRRLLRFTVWTVSRVL